MSNLSFTVDTSSPFESISSPASQAASPSSPPAELFDVDESMSDIMSAILGRSSSPDYSTTSEESGGFEEVEYGGSLVESIVSTESTASTESTVSIESIVPAVSIKSTVSNKGTLNGDADDEQSSSGGYESGSPKTVYQSSLKIEGSISNESAEAEDGQSTEVDENVRMLFEHENIRLEVDYRCKTGMRTNGVPQKDSICLEVTCYRKSETRASKKSNPREDENGLATATSHMEGVINSPVEEQALSEPMGQVIQVNDPDIGSPMSIDFLTEYSTPSSPPSIHGDNTVLNYLTTPSPALPNLDITTLIASGSSGLNSPHTHAHPTLPLRYSLPSSRHHPYKRTP
ncbi:hypothetical protein FRC12_011145 [Ceratobasidium sp. 428]|nr:hypothetical protein FRC12_011145 [Ceratobasidium sp. 428]